ncbi:hypothetical protein GCM10018793_03140 [Streptomyces sulfonofaciens]|uniref:Uncharacterized protein n=1 Tax=Streptomyces sulfonofaciens TaxID=68272 RepID=A0A919KRN4_9ACTN|nr:hypothetical protein GCM10018793_03140 [Streptomyces sulfonofaciens]
MHRPPGLREFAKHTNCLVVTIRPSRVHLPPNTSYYRPIDSFGCSFDNSGGIRSEAQGRLAADIRQPLKRGGIPLATHTRIPPTPDPVPGAGFGLHQLPLELREVRHHRR